MSTYPANNLYPSDSLYPELDNPLSAGVGATSATFTLRLGAGAATVAGAGATAARGVPPVPLPDTAEGTFDGSTFGGGIDWLYGLQESQGSATAGDVSGVGGRPTLTLSTFTDVGTAEFGAAGIMPEGTALAFAPAIPDGESDPTGRTLGSSDVTAYLGAEFTVLCVFAWTGGSGSVRLLDVGGGELTLTATPSTVTATVTGAATSATVAVATATNDNRPHCAVISGTASTLWLTVDDEQESTFPYSSGIVGTTKGLTVGDSTTTNPHQVAWVGYIAAGTSPAAALDLANLGSGGSEPSGDRVRRICSWLGVGADLFADDGLSDVAYQATGGNQALDLIAEANRVEDGVFFAAGDGTLRQHARDRRYDAAVRLELDATQVGPDTAVQVDLARVVNDLTVSRPAGATYRVHDAASVAAYGQRSATETLYAATDDALRLAAEWRVLRYSQPAPRIPAISINLLPMTADEAAAVLGLEIGDRVRVTSMPASTPGGTTVDLVVEGMEEQVSATSWTVSLSTSPYFAVQPSHFDDATFGAAIFAY